MNAFPSNVRKSNPSFNGLLVATLVLSMLPIVASADYRVSAFQGAPGFTQIMEAQYEEAIEVLSSTAQRAERAPKYVLVANLCVSEMMIQTPEAALESCNAALDSLSAYSSAIFSRQDRKQSASVLLSNRGVVLALKGDLGGAESDFARAVDYDSRNVNAKKNLAHLRSKQLAAISTGS